MNAEQVETLSRYLDGDLSPEEDRELELALENDSALGDELAEMRLLREAIGAIAQRDEPPAELDVLVEPLRRARARTPSVRPAYGWLAAAASLVFAVSIGVQLAQRQPMAEGIEANRSAGSSDGAQQKGASGGRTYFQLQPMPRFKGEDEAPLGAAEALIATPLAFPEPDSQPALEVVGPLPEPPQNQAGSGAEDLAETDSVQGRSRPLEDEQPGADGRETTLRRKARQLGMTSEERKTDFEAPSPSGSALFQLAGQQGWTPVTVSTNVPAGRYRLRLKMESGQITAVVTIESGPSLALSTRDALAASLQGVSVGERNDSGELLGVLEVESGASSTGEQD